MKYEEIKIGDVFSYLGSEQTVISKSDKHRIITTIDSKIRATTWSEEDLPYLKPIKEQLPEEGLLISSSGSLVYKLSDGSGYGFALGKQFMYFFNKAWGFSVDYWKPATPEQEKKFVEMLKKECEKHGLYKDTKLSECGINSFISGVNKGVFYSVAPAPHTIWNKNGRIFYKGKFATPLKEDLLDKVTKVVNKFGNHIIEKTESGLIIITPIKNHGRNKKKI